MILTGTNLYQYELYPQNVASFLIESTGVYDFGIKFTGPSSTGELTLKSGRIYDRDYNVITCYSSGSPTSLQLNYETGRYSLWQNGKLFVADKKFLGTGYLTGFSISGLSANKVDLSLSIGGSAPSLSFGSLMTSDLTNFTGQITIGGYPGRLYAVYPEYGSGKSVPAGKFNIGEYVISGRNLWSGSTINCDFEFDFGTVNNDVEVTYQQTGVGAGYLTIGGGGSVFTTGTNGAPFQYTDYIVTSTYQTGTNFEVWLQHKYRSGVYQVSGSGYGSGRMMGYIEGSGYVYGEATGIVTTGYYNTPTGIQEVIDPGRWATGQSSVRTFATGELVLSYAVLASGYENHYFVGQELLTGYIYGTVTGQVTLAEEGKYVFDQFVTGKPTLATGSYYYSHNPASVYSGEYRPAVFASWYENDYEGQMNYTGRLWVTGILSALMDGLYTGFVTKSWESGIYQAGTGFVTGFNLQTGEYDLSTGSIEFVNANYYDYAANGYRTGGYLLKPTPLSLERGLYQVGVRVSYNRSAPEGLGDYYELVARNQYDSVTLTGAGFAYDY